MIFNNPPKLPGNKGIDKYVQNDLYTWMRSLVSGLNSRISFSNNFNQFLASNIVILAGETAEIPNRFNVIPTERIIVKQEGDGLVTDGEWSLKTLRLINNGSNTVTISVRFFYTY